MRLLDPAFTLRERKRREPFETFHIVRENGERVFVAQRWWFGFNSRYVMVFDDAGKQTRVRLHDIASIEDTK